MRTRTILLYALLLSACAEAVGPKSPVSDAFPSVDTLSAADQKSALGTIKLLGDLAYAQVSGPVDYSSSPRYRGFRIAAQPGDHVDVWVSAVGGDDGDDGDAVAWLLDAKMAVVATNDDASDSTLDAHIAVDIAAGADPTHYVVFRDYANAKAVFTVSLTGGPIMKICHRDSDCVRVADSCCAVGNNWDAVATGQELAYQQKLACDAHQFCPTFVVADDDTQAECNQRTHLCEAVKPAAIACGGGMPNAHACPESFACVGGPIDRPGNCAQECGGSQGCRGDSVCSTNPDCEVGEVGCLGICR